MLWSIAWKNVWRNKLRSLIVISAVSVGIFGSIYSFALMNGIINQKIISTIELETSHIQIHHPKFKENKEAKYFITDVDEIIAEISKIPEVKSVSKRTLFLSIATTSSSSTGALICGINLVDEKKTSKIWTKIQDSSGTFFESEKNNQILISINLYDRLQLSNFEITEKTLGELRENNIPEEIISKITIIKDFKFRSRKNFKDSLKIILGKKLFNNFKNSIINYSRTYKLKSNIIIKMQDFNGNFVEKAYKIGGVYTTGNDLFDDFYMFVRNNELAELLGYNENSAHEILILLKDEKDTEKVVNNLKTIYPDLQIQSWGELKPVIKLIQKWINISYFIFTGIILFALGFGIVNTMLMVVLERVKEFGMLMAIGMNKLNLFKMIMLESVFLTLIGGITGLIATAIVIIFYSKTGHDFSRWVGEGYKTIGFDSVIYPSLDLLHYFGLGIYVILTGIIAAIYPAKKALKLHPVEAIKSDN